MNISQVDFGNDGPCGFPDDLMILSITLKEGPPTGTTFCSSYGKAEGAGFTDRKGRQYIVLQFGEGHGTGLARTPYLAVFRLLHPWRLVEILRTTMNWGTGVAAEFDYTAEPKINAVGSLEITLRGSAAWGDLNLCCVPTRMNRTLVIDP